jgi:general secretion pathway protein H
MRAHGSHSQQHTTREPKVRAPGAARQKFATSPKVRAPKAARAQSGMTLIEVVIVVVIVALGASGLSFSLGALTKANLRAGAGKLGAAVRFAYNRAVMKGVTVRIAFDVPGTSFSIEEAGGRVTLARSDDERRESDEGGEEVVAVDPWVAAQNRVQEALKPTFGASPFKPLADNDGKAISRYTNVSLGRRVQVVKLIVPHHEDPLEQGKGGVHFFPGGMTEHAVIQLSDGADTIYSVEVHPLTGRARIRPGAYEPEQMIDDPSERDFSEVDP